MNRWILTVGLAALAALLTIVLLTDREERGASTGPGPADGPPPRPPELRGAPPAEPAAEPVVEEPVEKAADTNEKAPPDVVPGVAIEGAVFDAETGVGIAGAVLVLKKGGSTRTWSEASIGGPIGRTVSDASGTFRFQDSPREGLLTLEALAAGYARLARTLKPFAAKGPRRVELLLHRAGRLEGKVQRPDGSPAAGAVVYVVAADAPEMMLAEPTRQAFGGGKTWSALRAMVGEDGSYLVEGLDLGAVYLAAAIEREGARSEWEQDIVPTEAAPWVHRDLQLEAPASLRVRLLGPEERPIGGARLSLLGSGHFVEVTPSEETAGVYNAEGLVPGAYALQVIAEGLLREEIPVTVDTGSIEIVVRLKAGAVITGVLVDDAGVPIANQKVFVSRPWWKAGEWPESQGNATTDTEGRFRIEGLRHQPHTFNLVLGKHYVPEFQFVEPPIEGIDFEVLRMASLRARLLLPPGIDAPEIVDASIRHATREGWPEDQEGSKYVGRRVKWSEGGVHIEALPPLACRVRLQVEGCAPLDREVTLRPGEEVDLGDIWLLCGLDVPVLVHDSRGNPIEGAEVWAREEHRSSPATTDAKGHCVLRTLAGGTHELEVEAEGFVSRSVSVELPLAQDELAIQLTSGALITCRVATSQGTPAAGATLRWVLVDEAATSEPDWEYDQTDHRGEVAIRVAPGRWRIEVVDEDWSPIAGVEASVTAGAAAEQRLVLPRR